MTRHRAERASSQQSGNQRIPPAIGNPMGRRLVRFLGLLLLLGSGATLLTLASQKKATPRPAVIEKSNPPTINLARPLDPASPSADFVLGAGDATAWAAHRAAARKAGSQGNSSEAHSRFAAAVAEARGFPAGDRRLVESLNEWAQLALDDGNPDQARLLLQEVSTMHVAPEDSLVIAEGLRLLGEAEAAAGRTGEAQTALTQARALYELRLGAYHPSVGQTQAALARIRFMENRYAEAEALFARALEIALAPRADVTLPNGTTPRSDRHPNYFSAARILADLGALFDAQGRQEEAETHYQRALKAAEEIGDQNAQSTARLQGRLGNLYLSQKRFDEAERMFKKSLQSQEKSLGPYHPLLAQTLDSLAALHQSRNEPATSAGYLQRAEMIRRKPGTTNPLP